MAAVAREGGGGGGGGKEEEEEHHKNPFLSTIGSKPASSKLQFRKEASRARWIEDMELGEVVEKKGSMWTTTGITRNGKLYCHIEEISFLAERGALLLSDSDETAFSMKDIYKKIASQMAGCSWEAFEAYRHLKSLGYIVGRHGIPWTMKSSISCCNSDSLRDTSECNGRSDSGPEKEITTMFKDLQITELKPTFDVYLPNSNFKKSSPGDPSFILGVLRERPPSRVEVEKLQSLELVLAQCLFLKIYLLIHLALQRIISWVKPSASDLFNCNFCYDISLCSQLWNGQQWLQKFP